MGLEEVEGTQVSIPTPPDPASPIAGPLERVEPKPKAVPGERFSHFTVDGYLVYVDANGRPVSVEPPLLDVLKGLP